MAKFFLGKNIPIITTTMTLLTALTAFTQNHSSPKNNNNMNNEKIIQTINNLFLGTDARDWNKVQNTMADSVLLDFSSMSGDEPATLSSKQIVDKWSAFLPGFDKTHHQVSDFRITENNGVATANYHCVAKHFLDKDIWTVEASYATKLKNENGNWVITKHKINLIKQSGNLDLPKQAAKNIEAKKSVIIKKKIQFTSDGLTLAGNLFMPGNLDTSKKYPTILVGGSWTTVKEQMSGLYAEKLAQQGFITLAIDPRYFGESQGEPRFWENPQAKIADYKNAISYLETVSSVDTNNIFLAAVCASAGYMAVLASQDKRIKALATVAGWLHDAASVKTIYGGEEGVQTRIKQAQQAKKKYAEQKIAEYIPAISKTDKSAAMFGDFDYYLNPKRGAIPEWSADKFAVMSWEDWLTFDPMPSAKNITIPTLMIHSDSAVLPNNAKRFFKDIATKDKILYWTEGTQFDFYDQQKQVSESVAAVTVFFKNHLEK